MIAGYDHVYETSYQNHQVIDNNMKAGIQWLTLNNIAISGVDFTSENRNLRDIQSKS